VRGSFDYFERVERPGESQEALEEKKSGGLIVFCKRRRISLLQLQVIA